MADIYGETDGDRDGEPQIIGQVSGPLSWTEDRIEAEHSGQLDPRDQFGRRNGTPLPQDLPDTRGRG